MNAQFSLSFQGNNQVPRLKVKWFGIRNRIMAKHCTTPNIHTHLHHHRANLPPARINTNGNGQHTHKHLNPSQPTDSKVNCSDGKHTTCLPFSQPTLHRIVILILSRFCFLIVFSVSFFPHPLGTIRPLESTCVLDSDFGFILNCAFKKSGLFRVRNLGGVKAHFGLGKEQL